MHPQKQGIRRNVPVSFVLLVVLAAASMADEQEYKCFVGGISWQMTDEGLMDGELACVTFLRRELTYSRIFGLAVLTVIIMAPSARMTLADV